MFLLPLLCLFDAIPSEFANLAKGAQEKMKSRVPKTQREEIYIRGQHKTPGIEFFLTTNLIGDTSRGIKGYAIEKFNLTGNLREDDQIKLEKYSKFLDFNLEKFIRQNKKQKDVTAGFLAVIANRKKVLSDESQITKVAFVDPKDGEILNLKTLVADDGLIQIYSIEHLETLQVFSNIRMYSTPADRKASKPTTNNEEEEGYNENFGLTVGFSKNDPSTDMSTIFMGYRYYWEKPTTGSDAFSLGPTSSYDSPAFKAAAGAYAQLFTAYDLTIEGLTLRFEADFEVSAMAGLGFSIDIDGDHEDIEIAIKKIPIIGLPSIKLLGIKLEFGIYVFGRAFYKNVRSKLIELMKYDYRVKMGLKTHLTFTTQEGAGFTTVTPFFEVMDDKQSPEKVLQEKIDEMTLEITPTIDIGIEASAAIGISTINSEGSIAFRIFLEYNVPFQFNLDTESCTFPYLYGDYSHKATLNFEIEGKLKLLGYNLIDSTTTRPIKIFERVPNGKFCFFDSKKSIDAKFSSANGDEAYVVNPIKIRNCDKCSSAPIDKNPLFVITLDYYKSGTGTLTDTFPFPVVPLKNNEQKYLDRLYVITGALPYSQLKYRGYEADPAFDDDLSFRSFNIESGSPFESCGDDGDTFYRQGVCITTQISKAIKASFNQETAKPKNSNYISYKAWISDTDYIGIMTHSDSDSYKSNLEDFKIFDDTILEKSQQLQGEIRGLNSITLEIKDFTFVVASKKGVRATVSICDRSGNICVDVVTKYYQCSNSCDFSQFKPVIPLGCDFQKSDRTIRILLTLDDKVSIGTLIPFKYIQLKPNNQLIKSNINSPDGQYLGHYKIYFNSYEPNYIFDVSNLAADTKAIINKIYSSPKYNTMNWGQVEFSFSMEDKELYGTLRFITDLNKYKKFSSNERPTLACVIRMEGLQPLCEGVQRLDENEYVIVLEPGVTLFDLAKNKYWQNNLHSINIPFRRFDNGEGKKTFSSILYSVFSISEDKNPFCIDSKPSIGISTPKLAAGCIKQFPKNESAPKFISNIGSIVHFMHKEFKQVSMIEKDKSWAIFGIVLTPYYDDEVNTYLAYFREATIDFPQNKPTYVLTARQASEIRSTPIREIYFLPKDHQIEVQYDDGRKEYLEKIYDHINNREVYEFSIKSSKDYTFNRICNNISEANCIYSFNLSNSYSKSKSNSNTGFNRIEPISEKIYNNHKSQVDFNNTDFEDGNDYDNDVFLFEYDKTGYLIDYNVNETEGNKLVNTIKKQVVSHRSRFVLSKSWEGQFEITQITGANQLTIRASRGKKSSQVRIGAYISISGKEYQIPFSAEKWMNDIETFLRTLKIKEPAEGYSLEDIFMDEEGRINLPKKLYQKNEKVFDYETLVDYPLNNIECSTKYGNIPLSAGAIVGISIAVIVVIAGVIVGLVIFFLKRKNADKSNSGQDEQTVQTETNITTDI
ncbi:hypothetical protein TRFO_39973 [Tritrichomonas foetus]|uniref:MACPF domain-containing protein n=1 Tax=Tritrichomonas foetus TaxID=1144522 RepID=A0A1J4J6E1_9EUKA|nr:hypothetical protein TRFO_39973 [Tritrichomonas foetus]|eukprot:OHS93727.1 hypothetical protein TRFO_39973 [Tritrichomonas foetus]